MNRRSVLFAGGSAIAALGLTGCAGFPGSDQDQETDPPSGSDDRDTPEDSEAVSQGVELGADLDVLVSIDDSNRDNKVTASWGVKDEDGIEVAGLYLENPMLDEDIAVDRREPDGNEAGGETSFSQSLIPPGETSLEIRVEDSRGNTYSMEAESFSNEVGGYRLDPQQDFTGYETARPWDDTGFDQNRIDQQRQQWQQAAEYEGFVADVENDRDFTERDILYPNYEEADGKEYGYFDLDIFRDTRDWEEMLIYIVNAARTETRLEHDGPPSGHANRMAASAEKAIEEVRGDDVRAWGIYNPGHGTMMFYTEDEEADHRWYHADTTSVSPSATIQRPENALEHRRDIWSPFRSTDAEDQPGFHEGFDIEGVEGVNTYSQMKKVAGGGLWRMVASGKPYDLGDNRSFFTEEWLDAAYSHIREGGKIDPILEPIKEMLDYQNETEKTVGIYGSGLDDTRIAAGDGLEDVYDATMRQEGSVKTSEIENMLESAAAS